MENHEILSPFEVFDPFTGTLKSPFYDQADVIVNRSRTHLRKRTREQIEHIVQTINYMFTYRDPLRQAMDQQDEESEDLDCSEIAQRYPIEDQQNKKAGQKTGFPGRELNTHPDHWFMTPASALRGCIQTFDIEQQETIPDVTWSEYFAALALALAAESQQMPMHTASDETMNALQENRHVGEWLIHATEALGIADSLKLQEEQDLAAEQIAQDKIHLSKSMGGIKKNAATNHIKRDYIRWLHGSYIPALPPNSNVNYSAAAEEYYEEFLTHDRPDPTNNFDSAIRHKENAMRMLKSAERKHRTTGVLPPIPT